MEVSSHRSGELFAMLLKQLAGYEWEEIMSVFVTLLPLSIFPKFVIQLFLIVEKLKLVLEDI